MLTVGNEVVSLQGVLYSIFSLVLIGKYRNKIKDYESTVDKNVIKVLFIGITLSLISWIIGITGNYLDYLNINTGVDIFALAYLVLVLVIYVISYAAVKSPEVFKLDISSIQKPPIKIPLVVSFDKVKGDSKEIESKEIDKFQVKANDQLVQYMESEKPFLDPELSLPDLANKLDIQRNQLSAVINQMHNKNFYEFVNGYRVSEVKKLMSDPQNKHLKLMSLAYDAGFNSKASFNRIF